LEQLAFESSFLSVTSSLLEFLLKFFSKENPPIQSVVDTGVLPRLVELLQRDDEQQLQV